MKTNPKLLNQSFWFGVEKVFDITNAINSKSIHLNINKSDENKIIFHVELNKPIKIKYLVSSVFLSSKKIRQNHSKQKYSRLNNYTIDENRGLRLNYIRLSNNIRKETLIDISESWNSVGDSLKETFSILEGGNLSSNQKMEKNKLCRRKN